MTIAMTLHDLALLDFKKNCVNVKVADYGMTDLQLMFVLKAELLVMCHDLLYC